MAGPCSKTSRTKTAPVWSPVTSKPSPTSGSLPSRFTVTGTATGVAQPSTGSGDLGMERWRSRSSLAGRNPTLSTAVPSTSNISACLYVWLLFFYTMHWYLLLEMSIDEANFGQILWNNWNNCSLSGVTSRAIFRSKYSTSRSQRTKMSHVFVKSVSTYSRPRLCYISSNINIQIQEHTQPQTLWNNGTFITLLPR